MTNSKSDILESFENPNKVSDYLIKIRIPEFTCLCPKTSQPDFAIINIRYVPKDLCIELKSLKMYMTSYRNVGAFHEAVTNNICHDLVDIINPNYLEVRTTFNVRGGIYTKIQCRNRNDEWQDKLNLINHKL